MSNRRRTSRTSRSYRVPGQRRPPSRPPSRPRGPAPAGPRWWSLPWLPAVLAVVAEVGHLAAAFVEWPESTDRGAYHVVAAALLGLVAAAGSGARRWMLAAGAAVAGSGPALWLGGALAGSAPYAGLAVPVAAGVAAAEVALAVLLVTAWRAAEVPSVERTDAASPVRSGAGAR